MKICVIGLGRLGLPLAAALQYRGFDVIGADIDARRVGLVNRGISPFYEPLLDFLLPIPATTDVTEAVKQCDIAIVMVNTPSLSDGSYSLEYVLKACGSIGGTLFGRSGPHTVIISSTVMPGSCGGPIRLRLEGNPEWSGGNHFSLCYVPEFVALGNVINGFIKPDFVLIGTDDVEAFERVRPLYSRLTVGGPPIVRTNLVNAELAKIALNTFLTTKISFANQMAAVCENLPGANVDEVTRVIGLDRRVSPKFLKGAAPYGGPCFPRDDRALMAMTNTFRINPSVVSSVGYFNRSWRAHIRQRVIEAVYRDYTIKGRRSLGVLGLAFKPGTDSTAESFGMELLEDWVKQDRSVHAYDAMVDTFYSFPAAQAVVDAVDVVVLTTPDKAWRELEFRAGQTVFDIWRVLPSVPESVEWIRVGVGDA